VNGGRDDMILRLLEKILNIILAILNRRVRPPSPGPFRGLKIIETGDPMKYEADLPAFPANTTDPSVKDITAQRLTVSYTDDSGLHEDVQDLAGIIDASGDPTTPATTAQFTVPPDTQVTLTLVYVDDDGLVSRNPATQTFESGDDIPPTDPGDFGEIRVIPE
jgi:hypothetical protein